MNIWTQLLSMFTNSDSSSSNSGSMPFSAGEAVAPNAMSATEFSSIPGAQGGEAPANSSFDWGALFKNALQGAAKNSKDLAILGNFPQATPSPQTPMLQLAPMQYTTMTQFLQTLLSGRH